ncbi:MAG: hypothetical protein L0Y58_09735 [Verrucomicrobia subdivision 3 bacterium]|nr:hypothetical protein [Limisphaerales bacterium]
MASNSLREGRSFHKPEVAGSADAWRVFRLDSCGRLIPSADHTSFFRLQSD